MEPCSLLTSHIVQLRELPPLTVVQNPSVSHFPEQKLPIQRKTKVGRGINGASVVARMLLSHELLHRRFLRLSRRWSSLSVCCCSKNLLCGLSLLPASVVAHGSYAFYTLVHGSLNWRNRCREFRRYRRLAKPRQPGLVIIMEKAPEFRGCRRIRAFLAILDCCRYAAFRSQCASCANHLPLAHSAIGKRYDAS